MDNHMIQINISIHRIKSITRYLLTNLSILFTFLLYKYVHFNGVLQGIFKGTN